MTPAALAGSGLDPEVRQRIEQFVRPLYAGLDGVQTFDRVERLRRRLGEIAEVAPGPEAADGALLEILLLLQGVVDRLGSGAPGGRLDLFLRGLGLPEDRARRARLALGRLHDGAQEPQSPEECLLHDALLLESSGVTAAVERLLAAGRKRVALARALAQLDPGPPAERYRTARGASLGARRREEALSWIEDLRRRVVSEGGGA